MVSSGDPCFPRSSSDAQDARAPSTPQLAATTLHAGRLRPPETRLSSLAGPPARPPGAHLAPAGGWRGGPKRGKRGTKVPGTKPSALWTAWARAWARASQSRQPSVTFEQTLEDTVQRGRKMPGEQDVGPQRDPSPWWQLQATHHKLGPSGLKARAAGRPGRLATGLGLEEGQDPGRWPQSLGGH